MKRITKVRMPGKPALLRQDAAVRRTAQRKRSNWSDGAYAAGCQAVGWFYPKTGEGEWPERLQWMRRLQSEWADWFRKQSFAFIPQASYPLACRRFIRGFCETAGLREQPDLLLPTGRTTACVVTVMNEEATLPAQLNELNRLPFHEIVIVVNGSTDRSYEMARQHPCRPVVVHYADPLGYDVGRAVGAALVTSELTLFLDGDMALGVDQLLPFIYELEKGADVVLNPVTSLLPGFDRRDAVSHAKQFLNMCLGRDDLGADSLTAVPHALSGRALERLGAAVLAVPPLAHQRAIRSGLHVVSAPAAVDVIKSNRLRKQNVGEGNLVEQLILGDHLEALDDMMAAVTPRLRYPDHMRKRHYTEEEVEGRGPDQYRHSGL